MPSSRPVDAVLHEFSETLRTRFEAQRRVLSFTEYVALFATAPEKHARDAPTYLLDCLRFFGTETVRKPYGERKRWKAFDLDRVADTEASAQGAGNAGAQRYGREHLVGQEAVQDAFVRYLTNFVQEGRVNRLVLLHGPNGSAKSTFAACLMRALEDYSQTDDGALYRFSWVFQRGEGAKRIGFDSSARRRDSDVRGDEVRELDVRVGSELREHPLLLLPKAERQAWLRRAYAERGISAPPPPWLWNGELSAKNKAIFEALLTSYRGDLEELLAHVQVERYYISRRFRTGAVTIGPQLQVDAHERQLTAAYSPDLLPPALSSVTLFESYGELVDASGGVLEYSDLLKRPLEAWKYLLLAIETGEVPLAFTILPLNTVLLASSNDLHLDAFKQHPEYRSFRGRIHQIPMPYLVDYRDEQSIYDRQILPQVQRPVMPHTTRVASLWAVLTRLRKTPQGYFEPELDELVQGLSLLEKAELYATGSAPERLSAQDAALLRNAVPDIYERSHDAPVLEARSGASPREMRNILLEAAQDPEYPCLSPLALVERFYEFYRALREEDSVPAGSDHVDTVREWWLDQIDQDVCSASGIIDDAAPNELFERYVTHVSYWVKRERVYNPITGHHEDPDMELMANVERKLKLTQKPEDFRRMLISKVAAFAIDNPGVKFKYVQIFPDHVAHIREATYEERRHDIAAMIRDMLAQGSDDAKGVPADRSARAKAALEVLEKRYGYAPIAAREALSELLRQRYA